MYFLFIYLLFFFKQKTAYEMRISDWSSDVCSSDLLCTRAALSRFNDAAPVRLLSTVLTSGSDREWAEFDRHLCRKAAIKAYDEAGIGPSDVSVAEEIGRGACRERVCQSV